MSLRLFLAALSIGVVAGCTCGAPICETTDDCGDSQVCLEIKTCAPKCTDASQCLANEKCSKSGGCVHQNGCGADADCASGTVCEAGSCLAPCQTRTCAAGEVCMANGHCVNATSSSPKSCGGELFEASRVQANVMIALDKSGSMNEQSGGAPKWQSAVKAIRELTSKHEAKIRFGLVLFPGPGGDDICIPAPVAVSVGDAKAAAISQVLDANSPSGKTPIGAVLNACVGVPELNDAARANYVMLVTDGVETCNGDGEAVTRSLFAKSVKTYVVGFGNSVDPNSLARMARAGGTARTGSPQYFQADDAVALSTAFDQIAAGAAGCDFKLTKAPPDPSKVFVYVNGQSAPRDPSRASGWEYTPATQRITLYGATCDQVSRDQNAKVSIVYGCPDDELVEGDRPRDAGTPPTPTDAGSVEIN
jgi:hypothetical protein